MTARIPDLPPLSDDSVQAIDMIVDLAFWQLMLQDDLAVAERDVDVLCGALIRRIAAIRWAARYTEPRADRETALAEIADLKGKLREVAAQ